MQSKQGKRREEGIRDYKGFSKPTSSFHGIKLKNLLLVFSSTLHLYGQQCHCRAWTHCKGRPGAVQVSAAQLASADAGEAAMPRSPCQARLSHPHREAGLGTSSASLPGGFLQ